GPGRRRRAPRRRPRHARLGRRAAGRHRRRRDPRLQRHGRPAAPVVAARLVPHPHRAPPQAREEDPVTDLLQHAGTGARLRVPTDYLLLDLERLPVAGLPGGRRLARHVSPEGVDLTMEQWFVLVDGAGITVTATVDSWRYDAVTDELTAHALSLALPAGVDA